MKKKILLRKSQILFLVGFILIILLLFMYSCCNNCDDTDDEVPCVQADFFTLGCPDTSNNITWNSFGNWEFNLCGDDKFAKQLVAHCNWIIYQGHEGGYGEVLELAIDTNNSIVFCWANNKFSSFLVKEGWIGQSDEGIKIGSKLNSFINAYPNFIKLNNNVWKNNSDEFPVLAKFSNDSILIEILVGCSFVY